MAAFVGLLMGAVLALLLRPSVPQELSRAGTHVKKDELDQSKKEQERDRAERNDGRNDLILC